MHSDDDDAHEQLMAEYLRNELYLRMIISRNVFCGATRPRRLVGILRPLLLLLCYFACCLLLESVYVCVCVCLCMKARL